MKFLIPLLIGGIFSSILSSLFLLSYYRLVRGACKTTGLITSFDRSASFQLRQLFVPIVRFKTGTNTWVESQPKHSIFHELNYFSLHREVRVHYQKESPENFIIESGLEVLINWLLIGLTLCGISWLLL
ncbi:hypothetical protein [Spirosoma horti]